MHEKQPAAPAWRQLLADFCEAWPPERWTNVGVIVGCSGGADSVALLRAMCELRESEPVPQGFVVAAHYNHGLRGDESCGDEVSVADLAEKLGVGFECGRATERDVDIPADEASMRDLRREFFVRMAMRLGARYIATAHTSDDNVETVLHHFMRGTGPLGMAGIVPHVPIGLDKDSRDFVLARPFLSQRRELIREALHSIDQPWREDASNDDTHYRRNWIRHELIPLVQSEYPQAVKAMARSIELQNDWRDVIQRVAKDWLAGHLLSHAPPMISTDSETEPAIIIVGLQRLWDDCGWPRGEMSMTHWTRLADTIRSRCRARYCIPGKVDVIAESNQVTFKRR